MITDSRLEDTIKRYVCMAPLDIVAYFAMEELLDLRRAVRDYLKSQPLPDYAEKRAIVAEMVAEC